MRLAPFGSHLGNFCGFLSPPLTINENETVDISEYVTREKTMRRKETLTVGPDTSHDAVSMDRHSRNYLAEAEPISYKENKRLCSARPLQLTGQP